MTTRRSFDDHVDRIVGDFLQSVVVVDDEAFKNRPGTLSSGDATREAVPGGRGVGRLKTPGPEISDAVHDLDPKRLNDAFAEHGIVCSVLSPTSSSEDVTERLVKTASRSDLVVLDWVLNGNYGRKTVSLIRKILTDDRKPERRRLRTIAIYTGQQDLVDVANTVAGTLSEIYADCKLDRAEDALEMSIGPVRAAVFAKELVGGLPSHLEVNRVSIGELPARLRSEFATLTSGLVPGVAVSALAALREDTHRILDTLNTGLDASYLGHRAASYTAADSEQHLAAIVSHEIRSVLDDHDIGHEAGIDAIKLWLAAARGRGMRPGELIDNKPLSAPQVHSILASGLGNDGQVTAVNERHQQLTKAHLRKVRTEAARLFAPTTDAADESEVEFAMRMTTRTHYRSPLRLLQLGTIVLRDDDQWLVCVQPLCDSVRLPAPEPFAFLKLTATPARKTTSYVARHPKDGSLIRLELVASVSMITAATFKPNNDEVVAARKHKELYRFNDVDKRKYTWAAELKPEYGQKLAVDLGQQVSRVGLDELETLRLARRT